MRVAAPIAFSLLLVASACSDGGGSDDASGGAGVGGGNTTDAGLRCEGDYVCLDEPGAPWTGPVALVDSSTGCGDAFPDQAMALFEGLQPALDSCGCECLGTPFGSCNPQIEVTGYALSQCRSPQGSAAVALGACFDAPLESYAVRLGPAAVNCGVGMVSGEPFEATWERELCACGGFAEGPGSCDSGQSCVPRPGFGFFAGHCYLREGDRVCPGDFPNKSLFYTGLVDTRQCPDTCRCQGSGAQCSLLVRRYAMPACVGDPFALEQVLSGTGENCVVPVGSAASIQPLLLQVVEDGTCGPEDIGAVGELREDGQTTVCCT